VLVEVAHPLIYMQRIEGLSNFYQGVLRLNIEIEEHQNELHQNSHQ
jgi:hypothetical protein